MADAWRGDIRRPDRHPEQRRQIWARAVCAKSLRCLQTDGAHLDAGGGAAPVGILRAVQRSGVASDPGYRAGCEILRRLWPVRRTPHAERIDHRPSAPPIRSEEHKSELQSLMPT